MFLPHHISQAELTTEAFSLRIWMQQRETHLEMKMIKDVLYSSEIPVIQEQLQRLAPSVLATRCFNDQQLPFCEEVLHTELGHLFEHIVLDKLCELKQARDGKPCHFSGVTTWDWKELGRGVFHIKISAGWGDREIFYQALQRSVGLFCLLLRSVPVDTEVYARSAFVKTLIGAAH